MIGYAATAIGMFWVGFMISAMLGLRKYETLVGALKWLLRDPHNQEARTYAMTVLEE